MNGPGLLYALIAFTIWGLFPLYWAQLKHVDSFEILMHRMVWAACFMAIVISIGKEWPQLKQHIKNKSIIAWSIVAAILVGWNWGVYIYAVTHGHIIETSFGYYINPLVSVALGVVLFKERLRPIQTMAVGIATFGVLYLIVDHGELPIIALTLAFSFASYGAVKKKIPLSATQGMALESFLLVLPATAYLGILASQSSGAFGSDFATNSYLIIGGVITAIPLLFFAAAAQRVDLSIIGMSQYLAPTLQLAIGIWVFNEPFETAQKIAFSFVWFALGIYTVEGFLHFRKNRHT